MLQPAEPQLYDKTKLLRALRMLGFIVIYALVGVYLSQMIPREWDMTIRGNLWYVAALAAGMIAVAMLLSYNNADFISFTGRWKQQLIGLFNFFWTMNTARVIAYLLMGLLVPDSTNEGMGFLFFLLGVIILAPFQFLAFRAYAKRKGIQTWPNVPKD